MDELNEMSDTEKFDRAFDGETIANASQGRRPDQVRDSERIVSLCWLAALLLLAWFVF